MAEAVAVEIPYQHIVYRLYAAGGALLYIGRTKNIANRVRTHKWQAPWWGEVGTMETEAFATPEEAKDAERGQIKRLRPLHNKHHKDVVKLKEMRVDKGLSQRMLAEKAGVTATTVWKIEHGGGAHPATLKKLGDVLGVRASELMREGR